jgi:hypothetical protein
MLKWFFGESDVNRAKDIHSRLFLSSDSWPRKVRKEVFGK